MSRNEQLLWQLIFELLYVKFMMKINRIISEILISINYNHQYVNNLSRAFL